MRRGITNRLPSSRRRPRSTGFCHIEIFVLAILIIFLAAFLVFPLVSDSGKKPPRTAASEPAPHKPLPTALSPGTIAASPPAGETEPRFKPYSAYESTGESSNS